MAWPNFARNASNTDAGSGAEPETKRRIRAADPPGHLVAELEEAHVHRRHSEEQRGPELLEERLGLVVLEPIDEPHPAPAGEPGADAVAEPMHVEERQHGQIAVGGGDAPRLDERAGVRREVPVGEHGPLGAARGPRRVDDRSGRGPVIPRDSAGRAPRDPPGSADPSWTRPGRAPRDDDPRASPAARSMSQTGVPAGASPARFVVVTTATGSASPTMWPTSRSR